MLPTPSTQHIPPSVYPPAEDSYLLLDLFSSPSEQDFLHARFDDQSLPPLVAEVGTGSGVILAFLTANSGSIFNRRDILTLGTDINVSSCQAAEKTSRVHCLERQHTTGHTPGAFLNCICADLLNAVRDAEVDLLVFNPPYVPSDMLPSIYVTKSDSEFERDSVCLALATDGGTDGMEVTNRLLKSLTRALSQRGVAYVLLCKRNRPQEVVRSIHSWQGSGTWTAEVVRNSGRTGGLENLSILRIARGKGELKQA